MTLFGSPSGILALIGTVVLGAIGCYIGYLTGGIEGAASGLALGAIAGFLLGFMLISFLFVTLCAAGLILVIWIILRFVLVA
jgi:hypothetical protein